VRVRARVCARARVRVRTCSIIKKIAGFMLRYLYWHYIGSVFYLTAVGFSSPHVV